MNTKIGKNNPANQHPKSTIEKKPTNLCAPRAFLTMYNVSAMFDNHNISLFSLQNKQTFHMFSRLDLRFVLCSLDLGVLKGHRLFNKIFNYQNSMKLEAFHSQVINFNFLFQSLTRDISHSMENLVIDSLLR